MESFSHLRQLVALADTGNFRLAGQKLGVSHSAVSQTVKRVEENYGVELFERSPGQTVPTAFGERLIASARAAMAEMEAAGRDIRQMESFGAGRLVIGVDSTLSESLLSIPMTTMLNRFPALQFTVRICNRERWEERLSEREIDIYFGLQPDREAEDLRYRKLTLQPPSFFCRADHQLSETGTIRITDLADHPVIGGDVPDWFLWRILDAYPGEFQDVGDLRNTFLTSQDTSLLRNMLAQTNAIAILPDFVVRHELADGRVRKLRMKGWPYDGQTISGVAAWLRDRPLPPSASHLLSAVEQLLNRAGRMAREAG